jgi:hypothetical protein
MSFGNRFPRWAMAIWMSASFASFIAPIVASAYLTPFASDDWKAMIALLVPIAFGLGFAIKEGPLDGAGLRMTRRLRAIRPSAAAFFIGMAVAAPTALVALVALHLTGAFSREAALLATAAPLSLGGTAAYLIRVFWPAR